jgi:hypothetical protein
MLFIDGDRFGGEDGFRLLFADAFHGDGFGSETHLYFLGGELVELFSNCILLHEVAEHNVWFTSFHGFVDG